MNTEEHYKGEESLYSTLERFGLNFWESDTIKRLVRDKGTHKDDVRKSINVLRIYAAEYTEDRYVPRGFGVKHAPTDVADFQEPYGLSTTVLYFVLSVCALRDGGFYRFERSVGVLMSALESYYARVSDGVE